MSENDSNRTVPRGPAPAPEQTSDHVPADESAADPNRTAARPASETPAGMGTVARTPSDVARLEEDAKSRAAEGVPGYVLLGELGRGGMGVVHKARHVKLNRVVALKMMLGGGQASRGDLIRFLAEAEAVAAIKHENVVQVFDYGETDGRPYMALEFCPGGTLGKLLPKDRDAARAPREMAALVAQVARGVAAAHALGIVHRDLKPGNVFLDDAGVPKVADFGLAKRGEGSDVTREGVGMGSPAYMAPEQARNAKFVGPQADVWALGVILYEALTGTRPFTGTVQEILAKAQTLDPVSPRKASPAVPRDLELICLKCLAKQPHERYPTAKELADDLDRYLRGEPISVRSTGPVERAYKWVKRNGVVSGAAAAVFLALAVGAGVSLGFGLEARDQAEEAKKQKKEAEAATLLAKANEVTANRETQIAVAARNETKHRLAEALAGPIAAKRHGYPLTPYEVGTFWRVAELRRDDVAYYFLEEATATPLACEQFECRAEYVLHAAVGMDPARRTAAEELLLSRLNDPGRQKASATNLAVGVSKAGFVTPKLARPCARALVDALLEIKDLQSRAELLTCLVAAAAHLPPAEVAEMCAGVAPGMVSVLANTNGALHQGRLGDAAARGELAAQLCTVAALIEPDRAARLLAGALAKESDYFTRGRLIKGLVAVAARLEPGPAAEYRALITETFAGVFVKGMNTVVLASLARDLNVVAALLPPDQAAALCSRAARTLADELAGPLDAYQRSNLTTALATVAACLPSDRSDEYRSLAARSLADALVNEANLYSRGSLADALVSVIARMKPDRAASVLMGALAKESDLSVRAKLAVGLRWAAPGLRPGQTAVLCAPLARAFAAALANATFPTDTGNLAKGLAAAAVYLPPDEAARILTEALARAANSDARGNLGVALGFVAGRLPPDEAAKLCAPVARALAETLGDQIVPIWKEQLVDGLAAVAGRLEPDQAILILSKSLADTTDSRNRGKLAECLGLVVIGLPREARDRAQRATIFAAGGFATPHNLLPSLPLLHPHFQSPPRPLPSQVLVDLLKHPFCVGEARRAVLDALEVTYGRKFADQWEFVAYARNPANNLNLDLLTPPVRPVAPKPVEVRPKLPLGGQFGDL